MSSFLEQLDKKYRVAGKKVAYLHNTSVDSGKAAQSNKYYYLYEQANKTAKEIGSAAQNVSNTAGYVGSAANQIGGSANYYAGQASHEISPSLTQ